MFLIVRLIHTEVSETETRDERSLEAEAREIAEAPNVKKLSILRVGEPDACAPKNGGKIGFCCWCRWRKCEHDSIAGATFRYVPNKACIGRRSNGPGKSFEKEHLVQLDFVVLEDTQDTSNHCRP